MSVGEGVVFVVVGLGYAVITGALAWRAWNTLREARGSVGWPTVDGVILRADVVHDMLDSGRYQRRVYVPSVQYEYHVRGERFVNDAVAVSRPEHRDFAPIEALVRPYAKGKRVRVHVHPERPQRATLMPGAQPHDQRRMLGWLAHVGVGLAMAALGTLWL